MSTFWLCLLSFAVGAFVMGLFCLRALRQALRREAIKKGVMMLQGEAAVQLLCDVAVQCFKQIGAKNDTTVEFLDARDGSYYKLSLERNLDATTATKH